MIDKLNIRIRPENIRINENEFNEKWTLTDNICKKSGVITKTIGILNIDGIFQADYSSKWGLLIKSNPNVTLKRSPNEPTTKADINTHLDIILTALQDNGANIDNFETAKINRIDHPFDFPTEKPFKEYKRIYINSTARKTDHKKEFPNSLYFASSHNIICVYDKYADCIKNDKQCYFDGYTTRIENRYFPSKKHPLKVEDIRNNLALKHLDKTAFENISNVFFLHPSIETVTYDYDFMPKYLTADYETAVNFRPLIENLLIDTDLRKTKEYVINVLLNAIRLIDPCFFNRLFDTKGKSKTIQQKQRKTLNEFRRYVPIYSAPPACYLYNEIKTKFHQLLTAI
jgi:hypothetical protein